jgi:hypothetical protein
VRMQNMSSGSGGGVSRLEMCTATFPQQDTSVVREWALCGLCHSISNTRSKLKDTSLARMRAQPALSLLPLPTAAALAQPLSNPVGDPHGPLKWLLRQVQARRSSCTWPTSMMAPARARRRQALA